MTVGAGMWLRRSNWSKIHPSAASSGDVNHCPTTSSPSLKRLQLATTTPTLGRALSRSKIASALRRGGRQRRVEERAAEIQAALRSAQLAAPDVVSEAMGAIVAALVAVIGELAAQIASLETQLAERFEQHPDAKVVRSLPGLGTVLGARVLGEFGDDPNRYADAKSRKNYGGTSPITRASGTRRAVLARHARNKHLADAIYLWAFSALGASPGARSSDEP